jgi:hypothetical protein
LEWLNHFVAHVKPSRDDPVLLIMDNHASHCSLAAVLLCRDHHITLLTFPPHSSHKLQPLDKKFFGPLKTAHASELEKWLVNHSEQGVTLFHVSGLFQVAYSKTATVAKAEKAFAATGNFPFNPDAITEDEFTSSYVTERNPDVVHQLPKMPDSGTADANAKRRTIIMNESENVTYLRIQNGNHDSSFLPPETGIKVSMSEISPLPKCTKERKRAPQKYQIPSSSPCKRNLEEKEREKLKENKEK